MKYHKHTIKVVKEDLGYDDERLNKVYEVYDEDGNYVNVAWTLGSAKDYIDSGYDDTYL